MQFKHPEILYFLALLIIPILVHLFQLQRFVKVPFTNVAFLQKLAMQTRKSSRIKKWLVLATRLLGFAAVIFAFSQPYFSNNTTDTKQHTFIYLDNSLSTNAKGKKGNLLKIASQEIIETIENTDNFSLLTNTNYYKNISSEELKNTLLKTENSAKKLPFNDVLLKISTHKKSNDNKLNKNILISDFQNIKKEHFTETNEKLTLVKLNNEQQNNLSIDSVFVDKSNNSNFNINIVVKNQGSDKNNIPIAIYNNTKLISKQTFSMNANKEKTVSFSVQKTPTFLGKIHITFSDTFSFDNSFYFALNSNQKINVLAIGNNNDFLSKIYTKNEFNFTSSSLKNTNYNSIEKQQLIIINELENLPKPLVSNLTDFSKTGGQLVVIPNAKLAINSYNLLFKSLSAGKINPIKKDSLKITDIAFSHPLFKNVFNKKISNFQYPVVQSYFPTSFFKTNNIISFENKKGFIKQINLTNSKLFWVASALNKTNSNFTNSPLIVPVFYNIGQQSLQLSKLYYTIDNTNKIDINTQLGKDVVLSIQGNNTSFIPLQQTYQNKVTLTTKDKPLQSGFYHILKQKDTLQSVAFNYSKEESSLEFLNVNELAKNNPNISVSKSVKNVFEKINQKNKVHWIWKWFLAIAIVSLLLEILILKYFKV